MPSGDEFEGAFHDIMLAANRHPDLFVIVVVSPRRVGRQTVATATNDMDPDDVGRLLQAALAANPRTS